MQQLWIRLQATAVIEHWRDKMLLVLPSHTVDVATTSTPYSDATQVGVPSHGPGLPCLMSKLQKCRSELSNFVCQWNNVFKLDGVGPLDN